MKSDMEDTLKIQRSPWLDWDVLEFEDVYLPVALEKEAGKGCVNDYKELFAEKKRKRKGHKILIKGGPGIGKTTFVSKMAYDWAMDTWKMFSLVFFVSLKMVNPGDPIENVIIDKNVVPLVYSEEYNLQKIDGILKTYGGECLLIFEGFDEGTGNNTHIMDIIKNLKYASSNFIVTTRPHVAGEIQKFFTSVVNVTGFTKENAEKYIRALLKDSDKVESVLRFTEENQSIGIHEMWRYPILLLFICILVNDDGGYLDLNDKNITLTDIYSKLHECLYKRYTIKTNVKFSTAKMKHTLVQLGKLALKGLTQGRLLYQKSELEKEVGKDAFYFGIIIGHQDGKVIRDLSADCTVSFLHQSIQEYLAALYMVDELEWSDRQIEDMWPGTWDYDTVSKVPLLLVFTIDLCKGRNTAKGKLLNYMAYVLNKENIEISGNLLGKSVMSFLALVTHQCFRSSKFTFVDSKIPDDIETIHAFIIKVSRNIVKLSFSHCKFPKTNDYDQKYPTLQIVDSHINDLEFSDSDVPVTTLIYLSQKGLLNNLTIDHRNLSLDDIDTDWYKNLLDLLSSPLPSLKEIDITTEVPNTDRHINLYDEQPHDLDDITDMTKYVGNLPNVKNAKITWVTVFGRVFCDVIFACLQGNQFLEKLMAGFEFEKGGITDMSKHVLSTIYKKLTYVMLGECHPLTLDRIRALEVRNKILTDVQIGNTKECVSIRLPNIRWIFISSILFFREHDIHTLLNAIDGSNTLIQLRINELVLPFMGSILQSKGLPQLTKLNIEYMCGIGIESGQDSKLPGNGGLVGNLPKLEKLDFRNVHGLMRMYQCLLKQFLVAVRGSHYLTVLDISGQNAAACLKTLLFPEGLPVLITFRANFCGLLPVDIYRLGKAAQAQKLPSLRQISLSKNPQLSNFICYLFLGSWPRLQLISLDRIILTSWDITCLGHAANKNQKNSCILPNVRVIECTSACATALKKKIGANGQGYLWNDALNICTPSKSDIVRQEIKEIQEDEDMKYFYPNLGKYEEQIVDKLVRLPDEDILYCSGVLRLQIRDFYRDIELQ